jgi:hypothetical protein
VNGWTFSFFAFGAGARQSVKQPHITGLEGRFFGFCILPLLHFLRVIAHRETDLHREGVKMPGAKIAKKPPEMPKDNSTN